MKVMAELPRSGTSAATGPDGRDLIAGGWGRNDSNGQSFPLWSCKEAIRFSRGRSNS